jgi:hypothetical protein
MKPAVLAVDAVFLAWARFYLSKSFYDILPIRMVCLRPVPILLGVAVVLAAVVVLAAATILQ